MTEAYDPEDDDFYEMARVNASLRQKLKNIVEFCNTLRGKDPWSVQVSRWFELAQNADEPRDEWTVAWDEEPSMAGEPYRHRMGAYHDLEAAEEAYDIVFNRSSLNAPHTNLRIEHRYVTPWTTVK